MANDVKPSVYNSLIALKFSNACINKFTSIVTCTVCDVIRKPTIASQQL